jgi:hypothetical protein
MERLKNLSLALAVLLCAGAAQAQVCTRGHDGAVTAYLDANMDAARTHDHDWMHKVKVAAPGWSATAINDLIMPGSHDAGTFGAPSSKGATSGSDKWAQTQTYSLLDQLCLGSRWFDVRFERKGTEWRIFHGAYYFNTLAEVILQFQKFIEDPGHVDEFVFVRLKLSGGSDTEKAALYTAWQTALDTHIVPSPGGGFGALTPDDLRQAATGAGGRILLLEYDGKKNEKPFFGGPAKGTKIPATLQPYFFDYATDQVGTFSNKVKLGKVKSKQKKTVKKAVKHKTTEALGFWWTSTGTVGALDVKNNTTKFWPTGTASPNTELEEFIREHKCYVGSFLIVDFYGDRALTHDPARNIVLDVVREMNLKSLATPAGTPTFCAKTPTATPTH